MSIIFKEEEIIGCKEAITNNEKSTKDGEEEIQEHLR